MMDNAVAKFCIIYIKKHFWKFALIVLFEIISAICSPLIALAMKKIIDFVSQNYDTISIPTIFPNFKLLVYVILLSILANRGSGFVNMFTMPIIRKEIRQDSFAYLQKHTHKYFVENFTGALGHRINELSNQFSTIFSMGIFHFLPIIISLITALYLIMNTNVIFGMVIICWVVFYLIISFILSSGLKQRSKIWSSKQSMVSGRIVDSIANVFNIRAFANYDFEENYIKNYLDDELFWRRKMFVFMEINRLFQGVANLILLAGAVFLSLYMLMQKEISLGDFVLIYSLCFSIMNNLEKVSINILDLFESIGSFKDSVEIINKPYDIETNKDAKPLTVSGGEVRFNNVTFGYNEEKNIFANLDIKINAKEKVGLVGVSGSGKTTFTNLILRLYDPQLGKIEIDGQDISTISQESLHKNITLIPQDPILFNRTLQENIKYGNLDASIKDVEAAAKSASADEFIKGLPEGYDSLVGERGVKLSGGQRQRIAIARAFLKNAPILIMDEATSSLDSLTEREISLSLKKLMEDRTVLIIAHRLSTLKLMNRIIVFKDGKIIEDGSHDELIIKDGEYAKMWSLQHKGPS